MILGRILLCSLLLWSCAAPPVCDEATGKCVRFDLEERGKTDREKAEEEDFWADFYAALLFSQ
jgi:hypothetical protein